MLRGDELFVDTVKHAIQATWPGGIQKECILVSGTENVHEVKLHGTPWNDCDGEQNFRCNQMMIRLLGELGGVGYKLICGTNLKGTMDSFFFFKEESYRVGASDFCILSLNNGDLIRLIDCNDMIESVENAINKSEYKIQRISSEYGGIEFKLKGCPWNCSGVPAIESRRLLCRISEELLAQVAQ
ncbi:uncharacterized protein LOC111704506 isoform X1 [Eurytemora carolleeae]|uniref:uncharacterized protein LOC111704506 isoform X1 n=1 Tax=Eurytemora carolleeae TaxID=1294199 RepID=UPI000C772D4E|nr:uncharacterized protein LOC111704506 isoform X1 [Eurytemora carolleeae]XP_023332521.1 uncharacterized protein LOC111704506 isoform X1 [Eurytemora carolleeae]|eukprot:XP_023332520.1 uncharacterized protein LOC111704506 isoform X1 [Eurytemora affinis]